MNKMYFSSEMVAAGELTKFVSILLEQSYSKSNLYNDIHIYPEDLGAFIVEWVQLPWDHCYGGRFEYVDEEHEVVPIKNETIEYCVSEDDSEDLEDDTE